MAMVTEVDWRLIPQEAREGAVQMALEEIAAETVRAGGPALVRVYQWDPSTLSLGYGQEPATVDWTYCRSNDIDVTRRPTGGGGIYHDHHGDISYSIVVPASAVDSDLLESYQTLCQPILSFFDRLGLDAGFADEQQPSMYEPACYLRGINPAHDILVDGDKISGNAQYRQRDVVIQHGSIKFELLPDRHLNTFVEPGVDSDVFTDRVTSIRQHLDVSRDEVVHSLEAAFVDWVDPVEGAWSDAELADARALADEKYRSSEWVQKEPTTTS